MGQLVAVYSVNSEKSTINMSTLKSGSYIISAQGVPETLQQNILLNYSN